MKPLSILINIEKNLSKFTEILKNCQKDNIKELVLNVIDSDETSFITSIQNRINFLYNAYRVKYRVKSKTELYISFCSNQRNNSTKTNISNYITVENEENPFSETLNGGYKQIKLPKNLNHIVVGGTFDKLHDGHRLLLNTSCILAQKSLNIGVTTEVMFYNKVVGELIESYDARVEAVKRVINLCNPNIDVHFSKLTDGIGISGESSLFDTLVTTSETYQGIEPINAARRIRGLKDLENFVVDMLLFDEKSGEKLSSSTLRWNQLGHLLRKPIASTGPVYVVGVTGCITSGKSSICKMLQEHGAHVVDCDILAHECYRPNTQCYYEVMSEFGNDIIITDSKEKLYRHIDRKKLGAIVFKDNSKMDKLCSIVWPYLHKSVEKILITLEEKQKKICVIEAAILCESTLYELVNEIWLCVIPQETAIQRIMDRYHLGKEESLVRYHASQRLMTSFEKARKAHVVISTLKDIPVTQKQVDSAWKELINRI